MSQLEINKLIQRVFFRRVVKSRTVSREELIIWFPGDEQETMRTLLDDVLADSSIPIETYGTDGGVHLTGVSSAIRYLDAHGAEIPLGFEDLAD